MYVWISKYLLILWLLLILQWLYCTYKLNWTELNWHITNCSLLFQVPDWQHHSIVFNICSYDMWLFTYSFHIWLWIQPVFIVINNTKNDDIVGLQKNQ